MKALILLLGVALVSSLAIAVPYRKQESQAAQKSKDFSIRVDLPLRLVVPWTIWNGPRNEFLTSGDSEQQEPKPLPLINIYNPDSGKKRTINVLDQFPDAKSVNVDGLAANANGAVLVACQLEIAGPIRPHLMSRILLYDEHSVLVRNFSAEPDDVGALAMDTQRNIYVLGTRDNERSGAETYPLIVKYDEFGHMIKAMLPRSLFANAGDPVGDEGEFPNRAGTRMIVTANNVEVYLAPVNELIVLNSRGDIQKRTNIHSLLTEFAQTKGYKILKVNGDEFSPSGDLWLIGQFGSPVDNASGAPSVRNFVLRVTPTGQLEVPPEYVGKDLPGNLRQLVGFTESNEPVAFFFTRDPGTIHLRINPY